MANEPELIPVLEWGETLTIQRNVNGKNVLMVVAIHGPCTMSRDKIIINARPLTWGESGYADGRVDRQRQSIDRLLARLEEAERLIRLASWDQQPGEVEEQANAWLRNEGEGTDGKEESAGAVG